ncbi:MAG: 50S ribosomal protein L21 [Patescibacteria group bacterium]
MFAVIKTGGKQYKVSEGDVLDIEKLEKKEGEEVIFDEVLLVEDEDTKIGKPEVKDVSVKAEVLEQGKGDKKIVYKYKPKKRQRKKQGHRQPFTKVEIKEIVA